MCQFYSSMSALLLLVQCTFHYCGKLKSLLRFINSSKAFEMVTIVNSEFIGNKNGSIHISYGVQNLSIINCLFEGNSYGIHGKLSSSFSGDIKNTDFIDNYNTSIKLSSNSYHITLTLNVAHCKFINNTSLLGNTNIDANGGAIVLDSLSEVYIRECIFLNNTSPWPGAAIYYDIINIFKHGQYDIKCTLSIVSCNFINNMATLEVLWNFMDKKTSLCTILHSLETKPLKVEP